MTDSKFLIWTHLVCFILGAIIASGFVKSSLPQLIGIEEKGKKKVEMFARTDSETSKLLNVTDNDNPGAYLAFPVYRYSDTQALVEG